MREAQERELNGHRYKVSPMAAMRALRLLPLVLKSGLGIDALPFVNMSPDEIERFARELLAGSLIDGKELMPQFDVALLGDAKTMLDLIRFAIEVNYDSFFTAAPGPATGAAT